MNRIEKLFAKKMKDVLAVYFTAGFPELNDTIPILETLEKNGVDLVEIGMPFSDPLADGPVIQESSKVALENGMSIELLFDQLKTANCQLPTVLMGYLNPVLQFGMEKFLENCNSCGIDGVILPDLPVEVYELEYKNMFEKSGVHFIFLITPRTPEVRIRKMASLSKGFLYVVSTATTTGANKNFSDEQLAALGKISKMKLNIPLLTGFGIHDGASFEAASRFTNGAVVGSAFIRELSATKNKNEAVKNFVHRLKNKSYDRSTAK